jgi:Na+/melibiose symporter-like transporter
VNGVGPIVLRLFDLMPANGSALLHGILAVEFFVQGMLYVMTAVMMNSMLADVVEDVAVKTGQRSEGLIFSADQFLTKAVSGFGVLIAGGLLAMVGFPRGAKPADVAPEVVWSLGAHYAPLMAFVTAGAVGFLMLYQIDRARHLRNLEMLEEREPQPNT